MAGQAGLGIEGQGLAAAGTVFEFLAAGFAEVLVAEQGAVAVRAAAALRVEVSGVAFQAGVDFHAFAAAIADLAPGKIFIDCFSRKSKSGRQSINDSCQARAV